MKLFALCSTLAYLLLGPAAGRAQNTGRIECARDDGYVYLYSSMTTLDIRATLQCAAVVQVTGRYDGYYSVRTAKGDTGYVPLSSVVLLKDQVGTGLPAPSNEAPARERIHYDTKLPPPPPSARPEVPAFTLLNDTPLRMKLVKTVSSATAKIGDVVDFVATEDVILEGVTVLAKGSKVTGVVAEAEPKKHFGRGGRLAISISSAKLSDGEQLRVRGYETAGSLGNSSGSEVPALTSGKDVAIAENTEFTVLVDGDVHLRREAFVSPKEIPSSESAPAAGKSDAAHP
jgi:hypothetical protein